MGGTWWNTGRRGECFSEVFDRSLGLDLDVSCGYLNGNFGAVVVPAATAGPVKCAVKLFGDMFLCVWFNLPLVSRGLGGGLKTFDHRAESLCSKLILTGIPIKSGFLLLTCV